VAMRIDAHSLRSQVAMGSESDCWFGQLDRILWISDSEAGVKVEKTGGVAEGECRCVEVVIGLLARDRRSLDILEKYTSLSADYFFQPIAVEMVSILMSRPLIFLLLGIKLANILETNGRLPFIPAHFCFVPSIR